MAATKQRPKPPESAVAEAYEAGFQAGRQAGIGETLAQWGPRDMIEALCRRRLSKMELQAMANRGAAMQRDMDLLPRLIELVRAGHGNKAIPGIMRIDAARAKRIRAHAVAQGLVPGRRSRRP